MTRDGEWRYQLADVVFAVALVILAGRSALGVLHVIGTNLLGPASPPALQYEQERTDLGGDYDWPTS